MQGEVWIQGPLAVGEATVAARDFPSVIHPIFRPASINQHRGFCVTATANPWGYHQPSNSSTENYLHAVLVSYASYSSSLDHISASSSSLLLNEPAWHILRGGLRPVRRSKRSRSNPDNSRERVFGLSIANDFFELGSHSLVALRQNSLEWRLAQYLSCWFWT